MIVVDTNVIVSLCIESPNTPHAAALFERDHDWCAPAIWRSEFRNVLAALMRDRGLSIDAAKEAVADAEAVVRSLTVDSTAVLELVQQSSCSAYDCEFVAVAQVLGTRLVTLDRQIVRDFPGLALPLANI